LTAKAWLLAGAEKPGKPLGSSLAQEVPM
jgi:hypothetical protein